MKNPMPPIYERLMKMSNCDIPQAPEEAPLADLGNSVPSVRHLQVVPEGPGKLHTLRLRGHGYNHDGWRPDDTPPPAA